MNAFRPLFWLLLLSALACAHAADDPRAHADYYIDVFGEVDAGEDPLVARAYRIFEQVRSVAEDPIGFTPTLKVIDSDAQPWAVALPDGYLILSRGALDICYHGHNEARGDARLAFVLGHELAHLVSRDFWHRNVFLSLSGNFQNGGMGEVQDLVAGGLFDESEDEDDSALEDIKRKELHADDAGFLYASLAGYQTTLIFDDDARESFLSDWVQQTRTLDDKTHLGPEERSNFLKTRFGVIASKVSFFKAGVQLAQFGRYRDAQHLFEAFAQSFPSHEVSTNLGYVHLQQALQYIPRQQRTRFWLPAWMVDAPSLLVATRGMNGALPPLAKKHLKEAGKYLNKAADARADDVVSRINLAAVYFQLGEFYKARARIEEARSLTETPSPYRADVRVLRALILNEQEKDIDMWPVATRILSKLADKGSVSARYNLARLYQERGRDAEARVEWKALLPQFDGLPEEYRRSVCEALGDQSLCEGQKAGTGTLPKRWVNDDLLAYFSAPDKLLKSGWAKEFLQAGPLFVEHFEGTGGREIVLLDGHPVLFSQRLAEPVDTKKLTACCGKPVERRPLGQRTIWVYPSGWAAIIDHGVATELWGSQLP